jgi:hypothetical protein
MVPYLDLCTTPNRWFCCSNEQGDSSGERLAPNRTEVVTDMSGNTGLPFEDLLHEFDTDQNPSRVVEALEAEHWLNTEFHAPMVLLNGLIANDKFCLSLVSSRKLDWVRGPRVGVGGRIGPASHPEGVRPPSGGEHATKVAGSTAVAAEVGCRAAVGSSLPTSPGVDSRQGIKRRLPAGALLYAKGEDQ